MSSPARLLQVSVPAVRPFDSRLGNTYFNFPVRPETTVPLGKFRLRPDAQSDDFAIGCPKSNEVRFKKH